MIASVPTHRVRAVAIGASAGGIEALSMLLPAFRTGCQAAIFIVVHLPRERPSLLKDLFTRRCELPVLEAEDKLPVEPGHVYFAPPDYHFLIETCDPESGSGPCCALSVDDPVRYSRPSIDVLFESAADHYGEHLMAVVLTGANEDGAQGIVAVARAGGITLVQDPADSVADAAPAAAVRTGQAQHVLRLSELRELLGRLSPEIA